MNLPWRPLKPHIAGGGVFVRFDDEDDEGRARNLVQESARRLYRSFDIHRLHVVKGCLRAPGHCPQCGAPGYVFARPL